MNVEEMSMTSGMFSKCHLQGDSSLDGLFNFKRPQIPSFYNPWGKTRSIKSVSIILAPIRMIKKVRNIIKLYSSRKHES